MADEPFEILMKDDTVVTNTCVGKDAGFDVNGVWVNKPSAPTPVSLIIDTVTKQLGE